MREVAYIGFGELGKQLQAFLHEATNDSFTEYYFDDELNTWEQSSHSFPFSEFLDERFSNCEYMIGLGYNHLPARNSILTKLRDVGRHVPNLVHHTSYVHPLAELGSGVVIYPHCVVDKGAVIEDGALLNNGVVVSHDSVIGKCSFLAPRVCVSGFSRIGEGCFLGTGTLVADNVEIGAGSKVGIGTVVTRNIPEQTSCIGNPMRSLSRELVLNREH